MGEFAIGTLVRVLMIEFLQQSMIGDCELMARGALGPRSDKRKLLLLIAAVQGTRPLLTPGSCAA